jgi:septal ring factor EnvC (AmiA/AmiB activator)
MTYSTIFKDAELQKELKRYKREVDKLRKVIDILETDLSVKEYEIRQLKERLNDSKKISNKNLSS